MRPPLATGSRLALRTLEDDDTPRLRELLRANSAYLEPWQRCSEPRAERGSLTYAAREIARERAAAAAGTALGYVVEELATGHMLGRVAITGILRGGFQNAYLGYWIAERVRGQGYAGEAVGLLVQSAFHTHALHRLQAAVMPRNLPSVRVLSKLGFRHEGHALRYLQIAGNWEDHDLYALTREEWPELRPAVLAL
jgi:[ribosomal protein S5]-alanine N-acetyltransferase